MEIRQFVSRINLWQNGRGLRSSLLLNLFNGCFYDWFVDNRLFHNGFFGDLTNFLNFFTLRFRRWSNCWLGCDGRDFHRLFLDILSYLFLVTLLLDFLLAGISKIQCHQDTDGKKGYQNSYQHGYNNCVQLCVPQR